MSARSSTIVSICILASRALGLIREILLAQLFGVSELADAFKAALRIPNFLQNLFGEGVLSACFIPIYSRLKHEGKHDQARQVAVEMAKILGATITAITCIGIFFSEKLVLLLAPGFSPATQALTSDLLQLMFPATGILVFSALCLGILNSHNYFALSYSSPLLWNISIIIGLITFRHTEANPDLVKQIAYFVLLGSVLQFLVQIPTSISLIRSLKAPARHSLSNLSKNSKQIIQNFFPVVIGRGLIQISSYLDTIIASFLALGSLSALTYAQTIYILPISVFGLANAATSLPGLSKFNFSSPSPVEKEEQIRTLAKTLSRTFFIVLPISIAMFFFSEMIINVVFYFAAFGSKDTKIISYVLSALSIGVLPSSLSRVCSSVLYAAHQQKVVMHISFLRLIISGALSMVISFHVLPSFTSDIRIYVVGIAVATSISALIELVFMLKKASFLLGATSTQILFKSK